MTGKERDAECQRELNWICTEYLRALNCSLEGKKLVDVGQYYKYNALNCKIVCWGEWVALYHKDVMVALIDKMDRLCFDIRRISQSRVSGYVTNAIKKFSDGFNCREICVYRPV